MSGELSDSPAIVACVDDFGLSPAVNRSVLSLAREHRISATSCLVNLPDCTPQAMSELPSLDLDLGLHLNFTEGAPLSRPLRNVWPKFPSLGRLLVASHLGRLPVTGVQDECRAQLERFVQLVGRAPDFVDGHQHVQSIPFLAEILAPVFAEAGVRTTRIAEQHEVNVSDETAARFYRSVADDARASRGLYAARGIDATESFIGLDLMGFSCERERLRHALSGAPGPRVELMCHPGFVGEGVDDFNQSPAREQELRVLTALPFADLVARGELVLAALA